MGRIDSIGACEVRDRAGDPSYAIVGTCAQGHLPDGDMEQGERSAIERAMLGEKRRREGGVEQDGFCSVTAVALPFPRGHNTRTNARR